MGEFLVTQFLKWMVLLLDTCLYREAWQSVPTCVGAGTGVPLGFAVGQPAEEFAGLKVL